ncbi:MAG: aspartate aminotransferase family protein [Chitinophagales bacterium]|nr:aspartate aminotransferase family protein [Chitinophagales bacterium]MDW8394209.1 aspartate aminotransferase family protein [Chitinophagales bacterium]
MNSIQLRTEVPGPLSRQWLERRRQALPAGLARSTEVVVEWAEGARVRDVDGNYLLDFAGGIGMLNAGHRPAAVVEALKTQLDQYLHVCTLVATIPSYVELAELLNRLTPGDFPKKTLLANSGSEAVENAVNLARHYTRRNAVVCFEGGYHGRTLLTLSLTSKYSLFKKGFGPFCSDIYRLEAPNPYRRPSGMSDEDYLAYCCRRLEEQFIAQVDPSAVAAILIEPVQGEGGFIPMPAPFLHQLRQVADAHGIVLIFDEIQCGAGRTGKFFACEHSGVVPDLICMAKSIGSGLPISAVTGRAEIMDSPHPGGVGGTYGGSPLACVAALETVKQLASPVFLERVQQVGMRMQQTLQRWKSRYRIIGDVRGLGAMQLVEFVHDGNPLKPDPERTLQIIRDAVAHGLLLIRAGLYSNCIRLLPPAVITDDQLDEGLAVLESAIGRAA